MCNMAFSAFPFDVQTCFFEMSSANLDLGLLELEFELQDRTRDGAIVSDYELSMAELDESHRTEARDFGDFSVAGFELILDRRATSYVLRFYTPCFTMVVVSMISFVIDPAVVPARTGLLVTLFLVLMTLFASVQVKLLLPRCCANLYVNLGLLPSFS